METNIRQSTELDRRRIATFFFGDLHFTRAFPQKTSLDLAHIQES